MAILEARGLKKYYGQGDNLVKAVDDISLSVAQGEFVAIVGTSGSGKTTLLNLLGGLDNATSGEIIIDGHEITGMRDEALTVFRRRKIGFVFQHYNLVSMLDVRRNITLPIRLDGNQVDQPFLDEVVEQLGIAGKLSQKPNQLSGGQQQRVAIARAIASNPAIVLADEPTGNLAFAADQPAFCSNHGQDHPQRGDCAAGGSGDSYRGRTDRGRSASCMIIIIKR